MATYTLAPHPYHYFEDNDGNPLAGGFVTVYLAGTTTKADIFSDVNGTVLANPLTLDASGRTRIFLSAGSSVKFVVQDADAASVGTYDNVLAVPASSQDVTLTGVFGEAVGGTQPVFMGDGFWSTTAGQWYEADALGQNSSTLPLVGILVTTVASGATGSIRQAGRVDGFTSLTVGATYYIAEGGGLTAVAPTFARAIGVADSTSSLIVGPNITPTTTSVLTVTTTGSQNNWAPGLVGNTLLRCNNATLLTVTGIAAGFDGQRLTIVSVGAGEVALSPQDGSSTAANRLLNTVTTGSTMLAAGSGSAEYVYDSTTTRWRLVRHDQGAWIVPTFAAGDYTGNASGAADWTVAGGDVTTYAYRLNGRALTVALELGTTTVANTPTALRVAVPNGYSVTRTMRAFHRYRDNAGTATMGSIQVSAAFPNSIEFFKLDPTATWGNATNTTELGGEITFEVT